MRFGYQPQFEENGMSEPRVIVPLRVSDLDWPHTADHCRQCSCETGYLARYIKRNHQTAIRWVCDWCEDYKTSGDLPHALLGDVPINKIPLRVDRSPEYDPPECEVCGDHSREFHHWAPHSIFPDWPYSLGAYLCLNHHREWHARMRAHGLRWPHELVDAS